MSSLPGGRDHLDRLARAIDEDHNADAVTPITLSAYNFGAVNTANPNATAATTNPGNANGFGPGLSDSAALRASAAGRIMARLSPGEVRRVLGQQADADDVGGNSRQLRNALEQVQQRRRRPGRLVALQNGSQQDAVQDALQSLGGGSRQQSAPTDGSELFGREPMCTKGSRQQAGGGDRVGDRQIDADTADRRHRVCGITDAEHPVGVPAP